MTVTILRANKLRLFALLLVPVLTSIQVQCSDLKSLLEQGKSRYDQADYSGAKKIFEKGVSEAKMSSDEIYISEFIRLLGNVYAKSGDLVKAEQYYQEALKLDRAYGNMEREALCLNNLGNIALGKKEPEKALQYLEQSLELFRTLKDITWETKVQSTIGQVYLSLQDSEKAKSAVEKSVLAARKNGDEEALILALLNLGQLRKSEKKFELALECFAEALKLSKKLSRKEVELNALSNLAANYYACKMFTESLEYYDLAYALANETGAPEKKRLEEERAFVQGIVRKTQQTTKSRRK